MMASQILAVSLLSFLIGVLVGMLAVLYWRRT